MTSAETTSNQTHIMTNNNTPAALVRVHRSVWQYLNGVKVIHESFAEESDLKTNVLHVVDKVYGFSNHSEAVKFSYELAKLQGA